MELHHLHVAELQAGAQRHRQAVAGFVARRRVIAVHGRPAAGGEQHRLGFDEDEIAAPHVDHEDARQRIALDGLDEGDGAVVLEAADIGGQHLFHQPVDDLDAGQIALVHRAVEALAGERLLMHGAVGVAVEETADLVLEFHDALLGAGDQLPGEVLARQPGATDDGVHEVALDRIPFGDGDVVTALDHARAAGLAHEPLDRDGDAEIGPGAPRMERREQPGAAAAEDQDVGPKPICRRHSGSDRDGQEGGAGHERGAKRTGDQGLLPIAPRQEFDRQQAQPAGHVDRQQHHERRFRKLDPGVVGPAEEGIEPSFALDRQRQDIEVRRQEQRQHDAREAVEDEGPVGGMVVEAPASADRKSASAFADRTSASADCRPVHVSAPTARKPIAISPTANATAAASRLRPRHGVISPITVRAPIDPWIAAARTKRP